jgi:transposase InsO family protein
MGKRRSPRYKRVVLEVAEGLGSDIKSYRDFDVPRSTFYEWKKAFGREGAAGLIPKKPVAKSHPRQLSPDAVEKIIELRKTYHLGPERITWYLERYHGIHTSCSTVFRTLVRHDLRRLPKGTDRRALHTRRYAKLEPGHHVQVDVKFVSLKNTAGKNIRRFQYTAIDDATRVRALKIYNRHNQANAINFIEYVTEKFPFRIHTIRTDRGHEFQAQFHWHVEDKGMSHVYIKARTPQLNGKVERSHRSDQEEFYQLLTYTDDVDLTQKLAQWERFYNYDRPHGAFKGKTPYEVLRCLLGQHETCL